MADSIRNNFVNEWRAAQAVSLTTPNLVAGAKQELKFLGRVSQDPGLTQPGPTLDLAVHRYETCWLPLLASQENGRTALVPPVDCAWVWHCHRLNPIQYAQDCKILYGKILGAPSIEPRLMVSATETTIELWRKRYPMEPYHRHERAISTPVNDCPGPKKLIGYNLVDAVIRQSSFYHQVSQPHVKEDAFLQAAEMRYKGFLHLAAKSKGKAFLVPTYDIDLMWHTHQLDPLAYRIDTLQTLGKVLDHDDTDSDRRVGSRLSTGFRETKQLWEKTYSLPYEKAGAEYRGKTPTSVQRSSSFTEYPSRKNIISDAIQLEQEAQRNFLTPRKVVQVWINILGARNVPLKRCGPRLFVRMRPMRHCGTFQLNTEEVAMSVQPRWNQAPWKLSFETSVGGIILELRTRKTCMFTGSLKKGSQLLGEAHVPFQLLLASPTLSALDWLPLHKDEHIWDLTNKPPALEIAASIAPPVPSPYLLRAVNAKAIDDNFESLSERWKHLQVGRWLTRDVLDHRGKEAFSVRIRKLKGCIRARDSTADNVAVLENERIIDVYRPNACTKPDYPRVVLAASAKQLMETRCQLEHANVQRQWAIFDPSTVFTVKINGDRDLDVYPELTLQGDVGYPVGLVAGRWMQYQVHGSNLEDECGFVTLIRYTPDCPTGKATALFNWKSAAMEVSPDENAVLVVLLSTVTTLAIHDLLGTLSKRPTKVTKNKMMPDKAEWGAVNLDCDNRIAEACGMSMTNHFWWTISSRIWVKDVYATTEKPGGCCGGDGACGGGACTANRGGYASS